MTVGIDTDLGPVITGVWCEICERWAPLDEADVIHGVIAHADCFPSHWVESRDKTRQFMEAVWR